MRILRNAWKTGYDEKCWTAVKMLSYADYCLLMVSNTKKVLKEFEIVSFSKIDSRAQTKKKVIPLSAVGWSSAT